MSYRALTPRILMQSLQGTVAVSAMILFIIVGATTFAQILSFSGATNGLARRSPAPACRPGAWSPG